MVGLQDCWDDNLLRFAEVVCFAMTGPLHAVRKLLRSTCKMALLGMRHMRFFTALATTSTREVSHRQSRI